MTNTDGWEEMKLSKFEVFKCSTFGSVWLHGTSSSASSGSVEACGSLSHSNIPSASRPPE